MVFFGEPTPRSDPSTPPAPGAIEPSPAPFTGIARKRSISHLLLHNVMSIYLLVTFGIFACEMYLQYRQSQQAVAAELAVLQQTFNESVSYSMWNVDGEALSATISGMLRMPSVTRVIVRSTTSEVARDMSSTDPAKRGVLGRGSIVSSRMPLSFTQGGQTTALGTLEIESNGAATLNRLKPVVVFAAMSALIKTVVLILLVRRYFARVLSGPLYEIARRAGAIDPKRLNQQPLPVPPGPRDELGVISDAINRLTAEVSSTVAALEAMNQGLESQVESRTAQLRSAYAELEHERQDLSAEVALRKAREDQLGESHASLTQTIEDLRLAQQSLVQSEKMAALGGLVAGISHEINTPIGLGLTGASHFQYMVEQLEARFREGKLEEPQFERFLADSRELSRSICVSLEKAAALVRSFKLVAVDQTHDEARQFVVLDYLNDVVMTFHPALRQARARVSVACDHQLTVRSFPGAWSQTISNLISNSLAHAFDATTVDPAIAIEVTQSAGEVVLNYRDNGRGMTAATAKKVFDPFFTTNRQGGGSGLGMHIVYNLVLQKLQGSIHLATEPGQGVSFTVRLPRQHAAVAA